MVCQACSAGGGRHENSKATAQDPGVESGEGKQHTRQVVQGTKGTGCLVEVRKATLVENPENQALKLY